jgi:glucose-1-phosphate adenylyltransferase
MAITEFEEKPAQPKSNHASMGVYIFTWEVLKQYLIADEADPASENDFGKNVIPALLRDGRQLFAYPFEGYWKDVGTLGSLWDANMDLLDPSDPLDMRDPRSRIYSRNYASPSTRIDPGAKVSNSFITEGCTIQGRVEHSVLHTGCVVEEGAVVTGTVLMPNTVVRRGSIVNYAIVGEGCVIEAGAKIGECPENCPDGQWGIAVVGHGKTIPSGTVIQPNDIV